MQIIDYCIAVLYDVRSKRMRLSCADVRAIRCAFRFLGTSLFLKASCMNLHGVSTSVHDFQWILINTCVRSLNLFPASIMLTFYR